MKEEQNAPMKAPAKPNKDIRNTIFHSISFFLLLIMIANIAFGTKKIRLIPCAVFCFMFKKSVRHIIKTLPPPIPMAIKIPEINPAIEEIIKFIVVYHSI